MEGCLNVSRSLLPRLTTEAFLQHLNQRVCWIMNLTSWEPRFVPIGVDDHEFDLTRKDGLFRIISHNILAQAYVKSSFFPHSPKSCLKWKNRSQAVLSYLLSLNADFLCLQELDEYETFYRSELEGRGYASIYVQRSGKKRDGCGIFFKPTRCELLDKVVIDYNDLVPNVLFGSQETLDDNENSALGDEVEPSVRLQRDCVGVIGAFKIYDVPNCIILIANTHLFWDPAWADVKLAQAQYLLLNVMSFQNKVIEKFNIRPFIIITGDFNSTPSDKVYSYLLSGTAERTQAKELASAEDITKAFLDGTMSTNGNFVAPIPLCSLYGQLREEPQFTNCSPTFTGTLDYIFFSPSNNLEPKSLLELPSSDSDHVLGGLPNHTHPSDHLPIGGDFRVY